MKFIILFLIFFLSACTTSPSNDSYHLKEAMAYGTLIELNDRNNDIEKNLLVRLYQVPINNGDCFIETHGVCKYQYYISVSTFDEYPEVNVFKLGVYGEIISAKWMNVKEYDYAEIEIVYSQFTKEAIQNNKALSTTKFRTLLKISPENIIEQCKTC